MASSRWIPWDVGYYRNPKIRSVGKNGRALHHASVLWAADNETDGRIPRSVLAMLCAEADVPRSTARTLEQHGLWHVLADDTGWIVHDFLVHNRSAEQRRAERERWARQKRGQRTESTPMSAVDSAESPGIDKDKDKDMNKKDDDDDTHTTPSSSSDHRQRARTTFALAAARALANKRTDLTHPAGWIQRTAKGLLTERTDDIDHCIDHSYSMATAIELLTTTPDQHQSTKPHREPWYADPNCERCGGDGWITDHDRNVVNECDCRRPDPYQTTHWPPLRSVP